MNAHKSSFSVGTIKYNLINESEKVRAYIKWENITQLRGDKYIFDITFNIIQRILEPIMQMPLTGKAILSKTQW